MLLYDLGEASTPRFLGIAGLRPIDPAAFDKTLEALAHLGAVSAQLMDADAVAGPEHILSAALLAAKAWFKKGNISRTPATEVLLYASGKRQIKEAIASIGVGSKARGWAVMALATSKSQLRDMDRELEKHGQRDDSLLELTDRKIPVLKGRFDLSEKEISAIRPLFRSRRAAIQSLILEQVALSEIRR